MIKLKSLFRRGGGQSGSPSSSTTSNNSKQQISHPIVLKSSASASSLERVGILSTNSGSASADLGATRKLSKNQKQSSKDKLNDLLRVGSKEKIIDEKKELKKQQKQQQKQMQQVAQPSSNIHLQTSSLAASNQIVGNQLSGHSKDFEKNFNDAQQDVSMIR
jgi:hypothetical protein